MIEFFIGLIVGAVIMMVAASLAMFGEEEEQ